jgi:hypothetical protein
MFIWFLASIGALLIMVLAALAYALATHLLIRKSLNYPQINQALGSPKTLYDVSLRHNADCYHAFNRFINEKQYLSPAHNELKNAFVRLVSYRRYGMILMPLVLVNFVLSFIALLIR